MTSNGFWFYDSSSLLWKRVHNGQIDLTVPVTTGATYGAFVSVSKTAYLNNSGGSCVYKVADSSTEVETTAPLKNGYQVDDHTRWCVGVTSDVYRYTDGVLNGSFSSMLYRSLYPVDASICYAEGGENPTRYTWKIVNNTKTTLFAQTTLPANILCGIDESYWWGKNTSTKQLKKFNNSTEVLSIQMATAPQLMAKGGSAYWLSAYSPILYKVVNDTLISVLSRGTQIGSIAPIDENSCWFGCYNNGVYEICKVIGTEVVESYDFGTYTNLTAIITESSPSFHQCMTGGM